MKKILAVMLLMAIMICTPVCSNAEDDPIMMPMADTFFQSYSISMSKSGTTIHIAFRVAAVETMAVLGAPTYDVQRLVNGTWTTVGDDLTGSVGTDTASYSFSKNYTAVAGYSYRVKAKFYAKKYNGTSKSVTVTSSSISV